MSVHMFRVVCEKPAGIGETQANQLVDEWLAQNTPWTADATPHELTLVEESPLFDAPPHFRGEVRFEFSDEKSTLREQITTDLGGVAAWYRVGYHECTHDGTDSEPCSWDASFEWAADGVTIPGDIPTFEVG